MTSGAVFSATTPATEFARQTLKNKKPSAAITFSRGTTKREALVSFRETDSWRAWVCESRERSSIFGKLTGKCWEHHPLGRDEGERLSPWTWATPIPATSRNSSAAKPASTPAITAGSGEAATRGSGKLSKFNSRKDFLRTRQDQLVGNTSG